MAAATSLPAIFQLYVFQNGHFISDNIIKFHINRIYLYFRKLQFYLDIITCISENIISISDYYLEKRIILFHSIMSTVYFRIYCHRKGVQVSNKSKLMYFQLSASTLFMRNAATLSCIMVS